MRTVILIIGMMVGAASAQAQDLRGYENPTTMPDGYALKDAWFTYGDGVLIYDGSRIGTRVIINHIMLNIDGEIHEQVREEVVELGTEIEWRLNDGSQILALFTKDRIYVLYTPIK